MEHLKKIERENIADILALTPLQEGIFFHYLKDQRSSFYFEQLVLDLEGEVDVERFRHAWNRVIDQNEMLRTLFRWKKLKNPAQVILKNHPLDLRYFNFSSPLSPGTADKATTHNDELREELLQAGMEKIVEEIKARDRAEGFDLQEVPFRITLFKIEQGRYNMLISNHHILYDGWSNGILLKEFFQFYQGVMGEPGEDKEPCHRVKTSFKEFIRWVQNQEEEKQEWFWKDYLGNIEGGTQLFVKSRGRRGVIPVSFSTTIKGEERVRLEGVCREYQATLAAFFYTVWGLLLQEYTGTRDVIFGTTVSGRSARIKGIEEMVGLFINTLPLRVKERGNLAGETTVANLLVQVNQELQERETFELSSLVDIRRYSGLSSDEALFDSLLVIENYPLDHRLIRESSGLKVHGVSMQERTHYDLTVEILLYEDIEINYTYNGKSFEDGDVERLSGHFLSLLTAAARNPGSGLRELEMFPEEEKKNILERFCTGGPALGFAREMTLDELFEQCAARTPEGVALVLPGNGPEREEGSEEESEEWTYHYFREAISGLARLLEGKGVKAGVLVPLIAWPGAGMLVAIMAILKAGGAYVPIDPGFPGDRMRYIIKDCGAGLVVAGDNIYLDEKITGGDVLYLDRMIGPDRGEGEFKQGGGEEERERKKIKGWEKTGKNQVNDPAYVIYTSGSTGNPKGVLVEHGSVVNLLGSLQQRYPLGRNDGYLFKTSFLFDVSVTEIFGWFLNGGCLVIMDRESRKDPVKILEAMLEHPVSHVNFVPSLFNAFVEVLQGKPVHGFPALRYIFLAGEELLPGLVLKFRRLKASAGVGLENLYGPTEATVYASGYGLAGWDQVGRIPIGTPLPGTLLFIFSKEGKLQPIGVPGELYIGGKGVARGYLNQPGLTGQRFLRGEGLKQLRCSGMGSGLEGVAGLYRTGDLVRWLRDGNIEFLGRMDQQVKIRGYRIELGEIESGLMGHKGVREAVVTARTDETGDAYLCAYYVGGAYHSPGEEELKAYLLERLPVYMVPVMYVKLERMPLTATGKVDKKILPAPQWVGQQVYVAPGTVIECALARIWGEVLGIEVEKIGIDHGFFEMGGHSLKATRVMTQIHKEFDIEFPLMGLFEMPTIRGLAESIRQMRESRFEGIAWVEEREYYPLSAAQARFFIIQQMVPDSTAYNMNEVMLFEGELDIKLLDKTFARLIERHESLRTSFHLVEGQPVQRIHQEVRFAIRQESLPFEEVDKRDFLEQYIEPFVLSQAPLLRVVLVKEDERHYYLVVDMHHIISDGTSTGIFIRDFMAIYGHGEGYEGLPGIKVRYIDYVYWQQVRREALSMVKREGGTGYALGEWEGEKLNLPVDYVRPAQLSFAGQTQRFTVTPELALRLRRLALEEDVTLYMLLLAVYNIFLSRLSGQETIVVGSPVAGRTHTDLENIMGLFIQTLVLKNQPLGDRVFSEFIQDVRGICLEAFNNQDYHYEVLMEKRGGSVEWGTNPLFNVMFVLQNMDMPEVDLQGLKIKRDIREGRTAKFDMTLYCEEKPGDEALYFMLEYNTGLFKAGTIRRFCGYLQRIITGVIEQRRERISHIELISKEEKEQILYGFNDNEVDYPRDLTVFQAFEAQVAKTPAATAVIKVCCHIPFDQVSLTYGELNGNANRLAHRLRKYGVTGGRVVAILMERSMEMVVALYGVLKAGGAYLPIDPGYPDRRISSMLEQSGTGFCLTSQDVYEKKSGETGPLGGKQGVFLFEKIMKEAANCSDRDIVATSGPDDLIYIIFTSGSTGRPKGAAVYHRGFMNLMNWFNRDFELTPDDRNLLVTSLSFDLTQKNFYAPLMTGGTLCIPAFNYFEAGALVREIRENWVTWINCTPSMFNQLIAFDTLGNQKNNRTLVSLRYVFLGGEPIAMATMIEWLSSGRGRAQIVNTYGPTECTDICAAYRVRNPWRFLSEPVPVGKPIYNVRLYIPDKNLQPLPVGVPGELYIGGEGVGMGYMDDKELTGQKFIMHSFEPGQPAMRLYRTGDLVKWLPDGHVVFLGRMDHQVKVRGFRIELGEIETVLLSRPGIGEAMVVAREGSDGDKYLCAYVVPVDMEKYDEIALRQSLAGELPGYMIPAYFVALEKMPLNPNGKVERKALPIPDTSRGREYVAPRDEKERELVRIWSEVLGIEPGGIGVKDNFFQLGGHSLKAASLITRIHQTFDVAVPVAEVFSKPFIGDMGRYIDTQRPRKYEGIRGVENREFYGLSSAQKRLLVLHNMDPHGTAYNIPCVYEMKGKVDARAVENAFKGLIQRHESLRTGFIVRDNQPVQRIETGNLEFKIQFARLGEGETIDIKGMMQDFIEPFDLTQPPLLRVKLAEETTERYYLAMDMHHIISDGVSLAVLLKEWAGLYSGKKLPGAGVQYKDVVAWMEQGGNEEKKLKQKNWWLNEFQEDIPILKLPLDYARPAIKDFAGKRLSYLMEGGIGLKLKKLALETGTTPFMIFLTVFNTFLWKLTGQEDIVVGTPVAGRWHKDMEHVVGVFINTLALRNKPVGTESFIGFLTEVRKKCLEAFENQEFPYEELVDLVVKGRDLSRGSLYDVMLVMQNQETVSLAGGTGPGGKYHMEGLEVRPLEYFHDEVKLDLTLTIMEAEEGFHMVFSYRTALFKDETMVRFRDYWERLLLNCLEKRENCLCELEMMGEQELKQLLERFNDTRVEWLEEKTIDGLFEDRVAGAKDRMALGGVSRRGLKVDIVQMTYGALNDRANNLAGVLREKGMGSDFIGGILYEPAIEMIVGIWGVIKAGGAFLPLEYDYPVNRIAYMLADSGAGVVLCLRDSEKKLPGGSRVLFLDDDEGVNFKKEKGRKNREGLVYTIYTSGSTGLPKGVMISDRNLVNYTKWFAGFAGLNEKDRSLLTSSLAFDLGYTTLFPVLINGGSFFIMDKETTIFPVRLVKTMGREGITYLKMTPSFFATLAAEPGFNERMCPMLRLVVLGGEGIIVKDVERVQGHWQGLSFINHYGPTETTIGCLAQYIERSEMGSFKQRPTIGAPVANTMIFILDGYLGLVPVGVAGQLCIGGEGVAQGYLNRPGLTSERFITWGKARETKRRLYLSGDMASWEWNGRVRFLGRMDDQVKIRGYRVETGEIEKWLLELPGVQEAVVVVHYDENQTAFLCGYVAGGEGSDKIGGSQLDKGEIKNFLEEHLPGYMVPAFLVILERMPLTANGKLDRKALPLPVREEKPGDMPQDFWETILPGIWAEVLEPVSLGVERKGGGIGLDDNFFDLGGHSLKAVGLIHRLEKRFNLEMGLGVLFENPTVRELARWLREKGNNQKSNRLYGWLVSAEEREYYPLSRVQKRLYLLHKIDKTGIAYNMPHAVIIEGVIDMHKLGEVFRQLIVRHDSFRTMFPVVKGEVVQRVKGGDGRRGLDLLMVDLVGGVDTKEVIRGFVRPFDLMGGMLLRVGLYRMSVERYLLVVDMPHIASDGVSMGIIFREMLALYGGKELGPVLYQYKDYVLWQERLMEGEGFRESEGFWLSRFPVGEEIPVLELPLDFVRPVQPEFRGGAVEFELEVSLYQGVKGLARAERVTLYMFFLAVYSILLYRLSGSEEMVIGTPVMGRRIEELENTMGMFVNTLALRLSVPGSQRFIDFLGDIKRELLEVFLYEDYPFDWLVEKVEVQWQFNRNPLFDVMFAFQDFDMPELSIPGLTVHPCPLEHEVAKFDLNLVGMEKGGTVSFMMEYRTGLFRLEAVQRFIGYFKKIVESVIGNPGIGLRDIELTVSLSESQASKEKEEELMGDFGF